MDESVEISRGKNALRLLENPLLVEALEAIESRFRNKYENTLLSQHDLREEAYRMLCAVKELRQHLTSFVTTGKMATVAQEQREEIELRERKLAEWDGSPDGLP